MTLIVVTPIHNEANNIGILAHQLADSTRQPDLWIVVDDGSTDDGPAIVRGMNLPMEIVVLSRENGGGLIGGLHSPHGSTASMKPFAVVPSSTMS